MFTELRNVAAFKEKGGGGGGGYRKQSEGLTVAMKMRTNVCLHTVVSQSGNCLFYLFCFHIEIRRAP